MLGGIFTRWKIIAAYYFTPDSIDSIDGAILKPIVQEIIEKAESIGLYIHSVTSDMGPVNLSMWRAFGGIGSNRYSDIRNCIPHPVDSNRKLFFIADAPHLLKNLKSALLNNRIIELPTTFVNIHSLSSAVVECAHLDELVDIQENLHFKLIPKIRKRDIICTTFNKMKVNKAKNIWSTDVSSAMKFYAEETSKNEFNTTAVFIEVISKWFTLITARTPQLALGKQAGDEKEERFNNSIAFLESIIELFREIKIGHQPKFKPVQNGIMITTKSIIQLTKYLIHERGYLYVLTGRFTQDCLENVFSSMRVRHPIPNALQFKQNLKLLTISNYIKSSHASSYDEDDGEIIGAFLNKPTKVKHFE